MKLTTVILFFILILLQFSCKKEELPFERAKQKISESLFISYDEESHWPNPVNPTELIDTAKSHNEFAANPENFLGYDFIMTTDKYDMTFLNGDYRIIDHRDSLIRIYTPPQMGNTGKFEETVNRLNVEWSPMTFLAQDWEFVKDTIFAGRSFADYFQIEMDTVVDGEKLYVERHIFINYETALIDKFERRAYAEDGSISQQVSRYFYNYNVHTESSELSYLDPKKYVSTYGDKKRLKTLKVGEKAPDFSMVDIKGDSVKLRSLRGKKVVLDFSIIGCGACILALKHISNEGFKISDKASWIYVNPVDDRDKMNIYMKRLEIPFPVLTEAKEIGELYGVNAYPTFFLIGEDGIIEKVQSGYSDSFINSFKM